MKFVLAGSGRSGTKWMATALRVAGINCGHEQVFATGQLPDLGPWDWAGFDGDSSLAAVPRLAECTDTMKVLVVRHPLDVAASFARVGGFLAGNQPAGLLHYLHDYYPEVFDQPDELNAAAAYWLAWNQLGIQHADKVALLEDVPAERLYSLAEVEPAWQPYPLPRINRGPTGDRPTWNDLVDPLREQVQLFAARIGY